jgi:thymidylate synthase
MNVSDIRQHFIQALANQEFTTDRTGSKTIELIGASFVADEPAIFGTVNEDYVKAELDWYNEMSTNINDIEYGDQPPKAWQLAANDYGEINSNYGKLIYSDRYYDQYSQALDELVINPDSRRATMIYTRPSIWYEYSDNGKNDFICTNAVTYYIRDGKLNCVVQMRSNDVVYGYKNDYAWQHNVLTELTGDYNVSRGSLPNDKGEDIEVGTITWQVQNLHVYERHFDLVK